MAYSNGQGQMPNSPKQAISMTECDAASLLYPAVGTIARVNEARVFSTGSKMRSFWLEHETQGQDGKSFKKTLEFEVFSKAGAKFDNTLDLDQIPVGSKVAFRFSLNGNVWNGSQNKPAQNGPRVFNSLRVMGKINVIEKAAAPQRSVPPPAEPSGIGSYEPSVDDMPF